jgi:hypothetical protein
MALGADFNIERIFPNGRVCRKGIATAADNLYFIIFWMNIWFHILFKKALEARVYLLVLNPASGNFALTRLYLIVFNDIFVKICLNVSF